MANETPSRPPPLHGKCHLKLPFWLCDSFPNRQIVTWTAFAILAMFFFTYSFFLWNLIVLVWNGFYTWPNPKITMQIIFVIFLILPIWVLFTPKNQIPQSRWRLPMLLLQRSLLNDCINPICPGGEGEHICPLCHVTAYICANTCTSALKKNLIFTNYKYGKGQCAFYPVKLSPFAEKNRVWRRYLKFIRGDPCNLSWRPLQPMKNYKSL